MGVEFGFDSLGRCGRESGLGACERGFCPVRMGSFRHGALAVGGVRGLILGALIRVGWRDGGRVVGGGFMGRCFVRR